MYLDAVVGAHVVLVDSLEPPNIIVGVAHNVQVDLVLSIALEGRVVLGGGGCSQSRTQQQHTGQHSPCGRGAKQGHDEWGREGEKGRAGQESKEGGWEVAVLIWIDQFKDSGFCALDTL